MKHLYSLAWLINRREIERWEFLRDHFILVAPYNSNIKKLLKYLEKSYCSPYCHFSLSNMGGNESFVRSHYKRLRSFPFAIQFSILLAAPKHFCLLTALEEVHIDIEHLIRTASRKRKVLQKCAAQEKEIRQFRDGHMDVAHSHRNMPNTTL